MSWLQITPKWVERYFEVDIPAGPVKSDDDDLYAPPVLLRGIVDRIDAHPDGTVLVREFKSNQRFRSPVCRPPPSSRTLVERAT